ncbi:hypothetical protein [Rhodococcus pyridinivorans]|nr:hypothetical protein [Rhodococcus pyridinivorans]
MRPIAARAPGTGLESVTLHTRRGDETRFRDVDFEYLDRRSTR